MEGTIKLVRDRVPELLRAKGEEPTIRIAHDEEFPALLRMKLLEEVQEFLESGDAEELVDVMEVVYTLARQNGMEPDALEKRRAAKEAERGGFSEQIVLVPSE